MYNSVDIWWWKYFALEFFFLSLFLILLPIDAFARVNICVNKCSFFLHACACYWCWWSVYVYSHKHTHTYAHRIVIKASRMHTYSSIFFFCAVVTMNNVYIYSRFILLSHSENVTQNNKSVSRINTKKK
jgi:hypothetical protein